jgi:hypothetical protein
MNEQEEKIDWAIQRFESAVFRNSKIKDSDPSEYALLIGRERDWSRKELMSLIKKEIEKGGTSYARKKVAPVGGNSGSDPVQGEAIRANETNASDEGEAI